MAAKLIYWQSIKTIAKKKTKIIVSIINIGINTNNLISSVKFYVISESVIVNLINNVVLLLLLKEKKNRINYVYIILMVQVRLLCNMSQSSIPSRIYLTFLI